MKLSVSPRILLRLFLHSQMLPILEGGEETLVGGQAVMEGVMMRAPHSYCVAVRRQNGSIVTDEKPLARLSEQHKIFKLPVFRGLGTLYQALKLGYGALKFSTDQAIADMEPAPPESKPPKEMPKWAITGNLLFSVAFMIFLYKFMPLLLTTKLGKVYPMLTGRIPFNLAEGIIRVAILVAFLYGVSRFRDMRRIFQYHGAEHKVVFNFESGEPVTVARAQQFTTFHPRCGTSFLMMLMFVAVPVYALIPFDGFAAKFVSRLALLPLIIGLSYELIRFAARRRDSLLAVVAAPGLWLQRITTQPPSDDQADVAIHALEGAMALEQSQGGELVIG
ncbi:MAG: DUF1385 domain-containing protein [Bryobacteraceae bacterium]